MSKHCTKCQTTKPLDEFGNNRAMADGKNFYCKLCHAANTRRWKKENWEATKRSIYAYRGKKKAEKKVAHAGEQSEGPQCPA